MHAFGTFFCFIWFLQPALQNNRKLKIENQGAMILCLYFGMRSFIVATLSGGELCLTENVKFFQDRTLKCWNNFDADYNLKIMKEVILLIILLLSVSYAKNPLKSTLHGDNGPTGGDQVDRRGLTRSDSRSSLSSLNRLKGSDVIHSMVQKGKKLRDSLRNRINSVGYQGQNQSRGNSNGRPKDDNEHQQKGQRDGEWDDFRTSQGQRLVSWGASPSGAPPPPPQGRGRSDQTEDQRWKSTQGTNPPIVTQLSQLIGNITVSKHRNQTRSGRDGINAGKAGRGGGGSHTYQNVYQPRNGPDNHNGKFNNHFKPKYGRPVLLGRQEIKVGSKQERRGEQAGTNSRGSVSSYSGSGKDELDRKRGGGSAGNMRKRNQSQHGPHKKYNMTSKLDRHGNPRWIDLPPGQFGAKVRKPRKVHFRGNSSNQQIRKQNSTQPDGTIDVSQLSQQKGREIQSRSSRSSRLSISSLGSSYSSRQCQEYDDNVFLPNEPKLTVCMGKSTHVEIVIPHPHKDANQAGPQFNPPAVHRQEFFPRHKFGKDLICIWQQLIQQILVFIGKVIELQEVMKDGWHPDYKDGFLGVVIKLEELLKGLVKKMYCFRKHVEGNPLVSDQVSSFLLLDWRDKDKKIAQWRRQLTQVRAFLAAQ